MSKNLSIQIKHEIEAITQIKVWTWQMNKIFDELIVVKQ